jgi:hypothetical protein
MMQAKAGDNAVMRKAHACGGNLWEIIRAGTDIGMKCLKCGHRVNLNRDVFERSVKQVLAPPGSDSGELL